MKTIKPGKLFQVQFSVSILIVLLVGSILIVTVYFIFPNFRNDLKFITLVFGGASGIYSAFYIGKTLKINLQRDMKAKSFDFIQRLDCDQYDLVRNFLNKKITNIPADELYDHILNDSKLDNAITYIFNNLDDMAVAIEKDFVDEEILYLSLSPIVKFWCHKLGPYFAQLRKKKDDQTIYLEIENLYNTWKKRTSTE